MVTALFLTVSLNLGLPPGLLSSLCYIESHHKINAVHHDDGEADSIGICQVKLATARDYGFKGNEKEFMKPEINILIAGLYLKHQIKRYNSVQKGVIAYNQGHAGTIRTSNYQRKVFKEWKREKTS